MQNILNDLKKMCGKSEEELRGTPLSGNQICSGNLFVALKPHLSLQYPSMFTGLVVIKSDALDLQDQQQQQ